MDKVFWPLLVLGIIFLFFSSPSYIEMSFGVSFVLIVVIWFRINEVISSRDNFRQKLSDYLTRLEGAILESNSEKPQIQQAPGITKDEMNDLLDKFAKKLIDVENKLNQVKKTLAAAFSALDERIKSVEEETFPRDEYNG